MTWRAALVTLALTTLPAGASGGQVIVPMNVGVGPATVVVANRVYGEQPVMFGLSLSLTRRADEAFMREHEAQIPGSWRIGAVGIGHFEFRPLWALAVPDTIYLSPPAWRGVAMYGASWMPWRAALVLSGPPYAAYLSVHAGVRLTVFYLDSHLYGGTFFARPGLEVGVELEIPVTQRVGVHLGLASQFYIPQELGGGFADTRPFKDAIWNLGVITLRLHVQGEGRVVEEG